MYRLVLASRNKGKLKELRQLLDGFGFEVLDLDSFPEVPEIEEKGLTFEENAATKAETAAQITGCPALADDSGLEVDVLDGAPGIYSSRFAGSDGDDAANNDKLLQELTGVPSELRNARFRCVVALVVPGGKTRTAEGVCEGTIGFEPVGENGFGYDPLFIVKDFGRTMAELSPQEKNEISHRAQALRKAVPILREMLINDDARR